jgi:hypothetical protein
MRTRRLRQLGYALAIAVLAIVLTCGLGGVAVYQRVVTLPRINTQIGRYRIAAYTYTIRTRPPQYLYIVWLFVQTDPLAVTGRPIESGRQILQMRLSD